MTKKPYDSYISGEYLKNNPTWDQEDSEWKAYQVSAFLKKNNINAQSIVEVGCGAGAILGYLHDEQPNVDYYGFEIAPDASKFWDQHASKNINFKVADFLIEETEQYDALLLLDVFEHVANPFDFLSRLNNRSKYFVFHIPLDLSAMSVVREKPLLYVRDKVGHIHYYTKGLALSLLKECGYNILDWSYTGAAFSIPNPSWKIRMSKIPRRLIYAINRDLGVRIFGGDTLIVLANCSNEKSSNV
jgi:cyclopropane fatty-acyl-phospholipid synthase-like methyltransferase